MGVRDGWTWHGMRADRLKERQNQALQRAIAAHQNGNLTGAEAGYRKILARRPDDPDALHFFGLLRHQQGQSEAGIDIIRRSLRYAPNNAHAWQNLGNILLAVDRPAEARSAYEKATSLDAGNADAWYNLGVCLRRAAEPPAACEALEQAVQINPGYGRAHYQLGIARKETGQFDLAEASFRRALELDPAEVYESLATLLYRMGKFADAADVYRQWSVHDPGNPIARHMAATASETVPARADDRYVAEVFDRFANTFDASLEKLRYRAPQLVAAALQTALGERAPVDHILDAGCGTGLCGPLLRPFTRRLTGVDLSSGMVNRARERGVYDDLHVAELVAFLRDRPAAFDAVLSADTLVYFGALEEVCVAAHDALRPGGILVFTIERMHATDPGSTYRLEPHGRYTHRPDYVERCLQAAGMVIRTMEAVVLRQERGADVKGLVVVAALGREIHSKL